MPAQHRPKTLKKKEVISNWEDASSSSVVLAENQEAPVESAEKKSSMQSTAGATESPDSIQTERPFPEQLDQREIEEYTKLLGCFFHTPIGSTDEIPCDYYMGYYLVYQTFESGNGVSVYEQDDDLFWQIPERDLQRTARMYLGLQDFDVASVSTWPFGQNQEGYYNYTRETSLPYGDITVLSVSYDSSSGEADVLAVSTDSEYETLDGSPAAETTLLYTYDCSYTAEGNTVYCLRAITEQ